jgi:hypothetical protein
MTGARIEVFRHNVNDKYRQIELAGSTLDLSRAAERIYKIVNKYHYIDPTQSKRNERSDDRRRMKRLEDPKRRIRIKKQKRGKNYSQKEPIQEEHERKESKSEKKKQEKNDNNKSNSHNNNDKNNLNLSPDFEKTIKDANTTGDSTISLNFMIPSQTLNLLSKYQNNNIYIELENQYGLIIEKKTEVLIYYLEINQ